MTPSCTCNDAITLMYPPKETNAEERCALGGSAPMLPSCLRVCVPILVGFEQVGSLVVSLNIAWTKHERCPLHTIEIQ